MTLECVQYAVLNLMLHAIFDCLPQHQPNSMPAKQSFGIIVRANLLRGCVHHCSYFCLSQMLELEWSVSCV